MLKGFMTLSNLVCDRAGISTRDKAIWCIIHQMCIDFHIFRIFFSVWMKQVFVVKKGTLKNVTAISEVKLTTCNLHT